MTGSACQTTSSGTPVDTRHRPPRVSRPLMPRLPPRRLCPSTDASSCCSPEERRRCCAGRSRASPWPRSSGSPSALMHDGRAIDELNCVRKHLSRIKGGRLAAACRGETLTLAISDVMAPVEDDPSVIGSGPTVADPSTYVDAWRIVSGVTVQAAVPPLRAGVAATGRVRRRARVTEARRHRHAAQPLRIDRHTPRGDGGRRRGCATARVRRGRR